jgi:hypothetical protein
MTIKEMKELAVYAAKGQAPANFSVDNVDEALRDGLRELAGSINQFMKNRYDIYEIIIEAADEIVPKKVIDAVGIFAEVQNVPQGQKAIFRTRLGRTRAKKFLTQVGLSGVYESFRLDHGYFELSGHAIGGACSIDFERMLDGAENMAELVQLLTEAQTDAVYQEVQRALRAAVSQNGVPANNRANVTVGNDFDGQEMMKLISTVRSYGNGAVIFAPPEFVAAMGADAIVPVPQNGNYGGVYHPQDIDAIHNTGYINLFRGTPIVQIPQSFVDENNVETWIDPQLAYVLPTGGERVVKVVFEGNTQMWDFVNADQSMEIHTYRKIGTAILAYHNWGIYKNENIPQTYKEMYPNV